MRQSAQNSGQYICLISIHGLIRSDDLELGRDADTGGQTKYVVELAQALSRHKAVDKIELVTRQVADASVDEEYSFPFEPLNNQASIVRIEAGPAGYISKELLWDYLDSFADNLIAHLRQQDRLPDLLHSHYADAGYVGSRLAHILDIPLIHTGHSLGRVKRRRLLASGLKLDEIESQYNLSRRIEAEETTLATAERVITSTYQEIEEQYGLYDFYQPEQMHVIPPGTDLSQFHPPQGGEWQHPVATEIGRFLREPEKPIILALSRPDERKNIAALVKAFGEDESLNEMANLVIVAGNRDDLADLDEGARQVLKDILYLIDRYDLYGKVAYPKHHRATDVPYFYRLAVVTGGVFVNPALTEPFGLTLIEAAASGLPLVATEDGGPRDIIGNCKNGELVDPLDSASIARGIHRILGNWEDWQQRSASGLQGVREHYSWDAHAASYLKMAQPLIDRTASPIQRQTQVHRTQHHDRAIFTDLDQNLLGNTETLPELIRVLQQNRKQVLFGVATGRRLDSALRVMKKHSIPEPDILITSGGTVIRYAPRLTEDTAWTRHIEKHWTPQLIKQALVGLPGLQPQSATEQSRFKISYFIDPHKAPGLEEITRLLHQEEQSVNVLYFVNHLVSFWIFYRRVHLRVLLCAILPINGISHWIKYWSQVVLEQMKI